MNELKYPVVKEGFRASREYLNFRTQTTLQLEAAIAGMFTAPSFIVGGAITINSESEFSISDGVLAIGGKLFHLEGDVYDGAPGDYEVEYKNQAAAAYPQQDHGSTGNVGVLENVFFENIAFLTDNPEGTSIALTSIDHVDLSAIVASVSDNADGIDENAASIASITEVKSIVDLTGFTFNNCSKELFFSFIMVTTTETVKLFAFIHIKATAAVSELQFNAPKSVLPIEATDLYLPRMIAVSTTDPNYEVDLRINGFGSSSTSFYIKKASGSFSIGDDALIKISEIFLKL